MPAVSFWDFFKFWNWFSGPLSVPDLQTRHGSELDLKGLSDVFTNLGFSVGKVLFPSQRSSVKGPNTPTTNKYCQLESNFALF